MKKAMILLSGVIILIIIVAVLANNKAKIAATARPFELAAYPVTVTAVSRETVPFELTQVGVITAENDVAVVAETQGKITGVRVKVGSYVTAGTPLVDVDNELQRARFLTAQTNYEKAKKDLERMESLYRQEIISNTQLESARLACQAAEADYITAKRQYTNAVITAPISGLISARPVNLGAMVTPGTVIANIVDVSRLKLKVNVAEADAFRLRVGDPVEVSTDVYPGVIYAGRIDSISAKGDEAHTFPVEILLTNSASHPLKAGIFGRAVFRSAASNAPILTIPRDALIGSIKNPRVYVVANDTAQLREIVIGGESGTKLMITQGLQAGEQVVVTGQENLEDGVKVTVVKK